MNEHDLIEQREAIQHDIETVMFECNNELTTNVCQIVVDRFKILLDKLKK